MSSAPPERSNYSTRAERIVALVFSRDHVLADHCADNCAGDHECWPERKGLDDRNDDAVHDTSCHGSDERIERDEGKANR